MRKKSRTLLAALTAGVLVLSACSGSSTPESSDGDGTRLGGLDAGNDGGRKKDGKRKPGRNQAGGNKPGKAPRPGNVPGAPAGAGGGAAPAKGSFVKPGPPSPIDPSLARRESVRDDPGNDAKKEGALVPAYGEVLGCEVVGLGEDFEMRFRFGGNVPQRMDDKNMVMVIGFGISVGGNESYGFTAQARQDGWQAYAGAKDGARRFPGEFLIEGDTIIMRVPWSFIEGPREFRWQANATWFRTVANTTHYSFDQCPNDTAADFPD